MIMYKLSKRMLMNVSMIPTGKNVADIGCDHGWVSIYLIQNKLAKKVFAMDVAAGPLESAREHIKQAHLEESIEVRLSDGLEELKLDEKGALEADVVLMAGIGGQLAVRLLRDNLDKCKATEAIVLQAQSELDFVRKSVSEMGFIIDAEKMVIEDGKYYTAMRLVPSDSSDIISLSEAELKYGPVLTKNRPDVLMDYLKYKRESYNNILDKITKNNSADFERISAIRHEIHVIDSIN